ncbi:hypothetical protein [Lentilactobacillus farraginis]|uniref:Uncharacterized protein n=1 Tax=Lentilactobacillus farraginis DSM 18382 = JCM 14108 TaxID=1423743 RepID=X0PH31_9LACO|nr:hypothetical protein [Lentilactobacillus farraginis]KRM10959.1 hypothetical protein FD41_GL001988 [Lentilactobacillus farraginis DSM 18382 = JCM 14108]GAF36312.1 hypothetical protein JCM14108_1274 [Lentilactobacillus farraginis DSM 18382 = JCM 14108]
MTWGANLKLPVLSFSFNKKFYTDLSFYLFLMLVGIAVLRYSQFNTSRMTLLVLAIIAQGIYAFVNFKVTRRRKK